MLIIPLFLLQSFQITLLYMYNIDIILIIYLNTFIIEIIRQYRHVILKGKFFENSHYRDLRKKKKRLRNGKNVFLKEKNWLTNVDVVNHVRGMLNRNEWKTMICRRRRVY